MKRALIVGSRGQDGRLLFDLLTRRGYGLAGLDRQGLRLHGVELDPPPDVHILNPAAIDTVVARLRPDEVYYLAAYHQAAEQHATADITQQWRSSFETHVLGLVNVLEAIAIHAPEARVFYACSSHVFGPTSSTPQTESTTPDPRSAYAISKGSGWQCCKMFRSERGLYVSVGVLYNHESHLRPSGFLSQKLVTSAVNIKLGRQSEVVVGDLSAEVDWGYAPDYVRAMTSILSVPSSEDFIIATGESHSVQQMAQIAFESLGLDWRRYVREESGILRDRVRPRLVGDSSKLKALTGWQPSMTFEGMVRELVAAKMDKARVTEG